MAIFLKIHDLSAMQVLSGFTDPLARTGSMKPDNTFINIIVLNVTKRIKRLTHLEVIFNQAVEV